MRSLTPLLLFCFFSPLFAQSDFVRSDFWRTGDNVSFKGLDATNLEPGPSGTGQTWNYANTPHSSQYDYEIRYDVASVAPAAARFPEATAVGIQDSGDATTYTFYSVTDSRIRLEGQDIPNVGEVIYTDKHVWIEFPFSYNETQTDNFVASYTAVVQGNQVTTNRTGYCTTTYDGHGTIILPDGTTHTNIRRTHIEQLVQDVVSVSGFQFTTAVLTHTYSYWKSGERDPIFSLAIADTTVTPPGTTVSSKIAVYRTTSSTPEPVAQSRGTHLTDQSGTFDSEILLRNPTTSSKTMTLQPYSSSGSALTPVNVNLPAGSVTRTLQESYFPASATSFSASGCSDCTFSIGYRAITDGASTAQVHQNERASDEYFVYPGEWDQLFDGAAIVNAGSAAAKVEARQIDDNGNELAKVTIVDGLAPGAKQLTIFNNLFTARDNTIIQLDSDQPIAVMILRISQDGRFLYQNLPLPEEGTTNSNRWIAHVTSETGGFDTDIYVHNNSGSSKTVTLTPYNSGGAALTQAVVTVAANSTRRFAKTALVSPDTTHIEIIGDTECQVTVGYRARLADASTAPIHEVAPTSGKFSFYPGEWSVLNDGVALVNAGSSAARVVARQIADNGTVLNTVVLAEALAVNAKYLGIVANMFPENPDSIIEIESSQPLAVLALRVSRDGLYLYGNEVLPQ